MVLEVRHLQRNYLGKREVKNRDQRKGYFTEPYSKFCEMILKMFHDVYESFAHKVMNFEFRVKYPYIKLHFKIFLLETPEAYFKRTHTVTCILIVREKFNLLIVRHFTSCLDSLMQWAQC